jgi:creatinine amidohydrolase
MRWDEMTPKDFLAAREASKGFCVLPVASIERHGNHLPLGIDSFVGEEVCRRAARLEPLVFFPVLRLGVNGEAAANPGAIALKTETLLALLGDLCDEIARNGFSKILLFSSHGGNGHGLPFFVQQWATRPRDYMVYFQMIGYAQATPPKNLKVEVRSPSAHGGVYETSAMMAVDRTKVKMDQQLPVELSAKLRRLDKFIDAGIYTAVNYYSNYPYHWAGPADGSSPETGDEVLDERARGLARAAKLIKEDETAPGLMREFMKRMNQGGTMGP